MFLDKKEYKHDWYEKNKDRIKAEAKIRYYSNHDLALKRRREYSIKNRDKERKSNRERQKQKYDSNPLWRKKHLADYRKWYNELPKDKKQELLKKNRERFLKNRLKYRAVKIKWDKEFRLNIKNQIMKLCGNGKVKCVICGIEDIDVLTIDHKNGREGKERKTIDKSNSYYGIKLWQKILKGELNKSEYQTLCMNCNWKRHLNKIRNVSVSQ